MGHLLSDPRQAVGAIARIAAGHDSHAQFVRPDDRVAQPRQHVLAADAERREVVVAAGLTQIDDRRVGRIEIRAALLHLPQRRVGQVRAVLDAANARLDRRHRALVAVCVCLHRHVLRRRLLHDRSNFFLGVHLLARIGIRGAGAFSRQDLDPVHAVRQVHLDRTPHLVDRRHPRQEIGVLRVSEECLRRDLRAHVISGGDDVRPGDRALLHELVESDIHIM